MFLALLMLMPCQGITLMHSPPMLYSTAARKTKSVPRCSTVSIPRRFAISPPARSIKKRPLSKWTEGVQTRYHLWFAASSRNAASRGRRPLRCIGRSRRSLLVRPGRRGSVHCSGMYFTARPLPFPPARGSLGRIEAATSSRHRIRSSLLNGSISGKTAFVNGEILFGPAAASL